MADTVTLGTVLTTSDSVNLGSGADKLTLGDFGNTGSIANVETLIGGSDADIITFLSQISKGSVDLGDGSDTLTLSSAANNATISNVETLIGGNNADTITLERGTDELEQRRPHVRR